MAWAISNGNFSTAAIWNTGIVPGAGEIIYLDGKTVTIDQNIIAASIRNTQRTGGTNGGSFLISAAYTLTCDLFTGNAPLLVCSNTVGNNIVINGNSTGSGFSGGTTIQITSTGDVIFTGNATGGSANNTFFAHLTSSGNLYMAGNPTGGSSSPAIYNVSTGNVYITGNPTGGSVIAGYGIHNTSTGGVYVTGTPTASTNTVAIYSTGAGVIDITGSPTASVTFPAIYAVSASVIIRGNQIGANGINPVCCSKLKVDTAASQTITLQDTAGDNKVFSNPAANTLQAPEADVRKDVVYGISGEFTGQAYIPTAAQTLLGVNVDDTVGTLLMTPADFWNAAPANADIIAIKERTDNLPDNPASVESTGDQIAALI